MKVLVRIFSSEKKFHPHNKPMKFSESYKRQGIYI